MSWVRSEMTGSIRLVIPDTINPSKSIAVTSDLSDDRFCRNSSTTATVPDRTVIALVGPISSFKSARSVRSSVGPGRSVLMLSNVPSGTCL